MIQKEVLLYYNNFLEKLIDNGLQYFYNEQWGYRQLLDWCETNYIKLDFSYTYGATRFVFRTGFFPYVVKIPIRGKDNYCQLECSNFIDALSSPQISHCFAACEFGFIIGDIPVYLMDLAMCNREEIANYACAEAYYREKISDSLFDGNMREFYLNLFRRRNSDDQIKPFLQAEWGDKVVEEFLDFCAAHRINDLRFDNFGYIGDRLVIVDYAGYIR